MTLLSLQSRNFLKIDESKGVCWLSCVNQCKHGLGNLCSLLSMWIVRDAGERGAACCDLPVTKILDSLYDTCALHGDAWSVDFPNKSLKKKYLLHLIGSGVR